MSQSRPKAGQIAPIAGKNTGDVATVNVSTEEITWEENAALSSDLDDAYDNGEVVDHASNGPIKSQFPDGVTTESIVIGGTTYRVCNFIFQNAEANASNTVSAFFFDTAGRIAGVGEAIQTGGVKNSDGTPVLVWNITNLGFATFTRLQVDEVVAYPMVQLTLINGDNDDIDIPDGRTLRIDGPVAPFALTGMANGLDGREALLINSTAQQMTISDQSPGSIAANQFSTNTGGDIVIATNGAVTCVYDDTDEFWYVTSFNG